MAIVVDRTAGIDGVRDGGDVRNADLLREFDAVLTGDEGLRLIADGLREAERNHDEAAVRFLKSQLDPENPEHAAILAGLRR